MKVLSLAVAGMTLAGSSPGGEGAQQQLYAAFALTKEQEASPLPTDSGVFVRSSAQDDWRRIGPVIQSMNSLAVDPNDLDTMFIACGNGVVRSIDGGETWRLTTGWRESDVLTVAIDPSNGDNVYFASIWGVSASYDGGDAWRAANEGLKEKYSRTIIVDRRSPNRLLVGTADGIYVSQNRARSWRPIKSSPRLAILRIARSEVDPDLWLAGTEGKGVYVSRNDGRSWEALSRPLAESNVYGVALDWHDADLMAAGGWGTGVWLSSDGGKNWSRAAAELPSMNITAMTFDANVAGRLWASTFEEGTYYTDDGGATWKDGDLYGAYVFDLGFEPMKED